MSSSFFLHITVYLKFSTFFTFPLSKTKSAKDFSNYWVVIIYPHFLIKNFILYLLTLRRHSIVPALPHSYAPVSLNHLQTSSFIFSFPILVGNFLIILSTTTLKSVGNSALPCSHFLVLTALNILLLFSYIFCFFCISPLLILTLNYAFFCSLMTPIINSIHSVKCFFHRHKCHHYILPILITPFLQLSWSKIYCRPSYLSR